MSVRTSVILALALAAVLSWLFFFELREESPSTPTMFFYQVDMELIDRVQVTYQGTTYAFKYDDGWHFVDEQNTPVNLDRWGGITLLLSGPQSPRIVDENPEDVSQFGLDQPETVVHVDLTDGGKFTVLLGDQTPDGIKQYVRMEGFPQVFLVDASWGAVFARLVTEPPYIPTPTPTPEPTPTLVPGS